MDKEKMKVLCTGGSGFIGTHLLDDLLASGTDVLNIDIAEPKKREHWKYWRDCNILDVERMGSVFEEFQPSYVVHLAARTVMEGKSLADFQDNTVGTANVLNVMKKLPGTARIIVASSQHVRKPGSGFPLSDQDFVPHGLYGESKVITERLTREAGLACTWTIIRPTTVWGPYHPSLPGGLWKFMRRGLYLHPMSDPVVRSYGYVKNVTWQIRKILVAPQTLVDRRVYYLGDPLVKQVEWLNAFSRALIGRNVPQVPLIIIRLLAYIGDLLVPMGIRFPMDGNRYFNLTTTNPVPINPVFDDFGDPPYSLSAGIEETVRWLMQR